LPLKPPQHRPAHWKPSAPWQRPTGETTTKRGYGSHWQKLRALVLSNEPWCRPCRALDRYTKATQVDHVRPKSVGGTDDQNNLQPICEPCHRVKTAKEGGRQPWLGRDALLPTAVPLVVVCGPPASGKSRYVRDHAGPADIVIDLDVIASGMSGQGLHSWDRLHWLKQALAERHRLLASLATASCPRAWFIVSEPKREGRERWVKRLSPERVVVLETPASTCIERVRQDSERPQEATIQAITEWWSKYRTREGDERIR
jgi:5-methylcytosine-specific restriction protein A